LQGVGLRLVVESAMRITCSYRDTKRVWETPEAEVVFGRAEEKLPIILDLSPDQRVSRLHGRIWEEEGLCWIEDLNSSRGTQLNGVEIKGLGKQQLRPEDSVLVGQTTLKIDFGESYGLAPGTNYLEQGTFLLAEKRHAESRLTIAKDVDATAVDSIPLGCAEDPSARRLKMVCDLPFQFATKTSLKTLLPSIVDQLVEVIPMGESWALVLREPGSNALLLKAYQYIQRTYLSETLLRRAMTERKAFIWKRTGETETNGSIAQSGIETGIYVPLLWQGEALGAICVGTRNSTTVFTDDDVKLLVLVGQYAAMAVATYRRQEKLRRESIIRSNLLRQFSPKVAEQLLSLGRRVWRGGQRSEVTILNVDIRGLTRLASERDPDDLVEMLNEYLRVLIPVVFAHNGAIDKFTGDTILAIFGGPESDAKHHENALRAAGEMQATAMKMNEARRLRGAPWCDFAIGIHCGEVVHGFVGTPERMEFTAVGEVVNRAMRYCGAAAEGEILISPETYERVLQFVETEQATIQIERETNRMAYRVKHVKGIPAER
jgi:adenylate cyclase